MRPSDLLDQLRRELPARTDLFTRDITASVAVSANVGTATAVAHGLSAGNAFNIYDSITGNPVNDVTQDGLLFTFTVDNVHDLTFGFVDGDTDYVTLSGFPESEWNDTFELKSVPTNKSFILQSTNGAPPTLGAGVLEDPGTINGFFEVATVPDSDTFTFSVTAPDQGPSAATVVAQPRMAVAPDLDTANRHYTEQATADDYWLFVIPGTVAASKDRNIQSDRQVSRSAGEDFRANFVEDYSIVVFAPTSTETSAAIAMDRTRHDLVLPLLQSVNGSNFDSGTSESDRFLFMFAGHQLAAYNVQYLVHEYLFENSFSLTNEDRFIQASRSYREFNVTQTVGDQEITSSGELP